MSGLGRGVGAWPGCGGRGGATKGEETAKACQARGTKAASLSGALAAPGSDLQAGHPSWLTGSRRALGFLCGNGTWARTQKHHSAFETIVKIQMSKHSPG